eukprot:7167117-Karenia_brevis.AAC.1
MPIFRNFVDIKVPTWEDFQARFGEYIVHHAQRLTAISGAELRTLLARMSSSSSAGPDAWAVDELKQLPVPILDLLAELLNNFELHGRWPGDLERALVSMLGKGEGQAPLAKRPITVMSVIYR